MEVEQIRGGVGDRQGEDLGLEAGAGVAEGGERQGGDAQGIAGTGDERRLWLDTPWVILPIPVAHSTSEKLTVAPGTGLPLWSTTLKVAVKETGLPQVMVPGVSVVCARWVDWKSRLWIATLVMTLVPVLPGMAGSVDLTYRS